MELQIVSKLRLLLSGPMNDEAHAVYFMVEVRKLLEHHKNDRGLPAFQLIRFYCDWVLHTKLDRWDNKPEILDLLQKIDADILANGIDDPGLRLPDFIGLIHLGEELSCFLDKFNLPKALFENRSSWQGFALALVQVLEDQPLEITKDHISIVEFRITEVVNGIIYGRIKLKDGSESRSNVAFN